MNSEKIKDTKEYPLKQPITNNQARKKFLSVAGKFLDRGLDMGYTLSGDVCGPLLELAKSFPNTLRDLGDKTRIQWEKVIELQGYKRKLGYAIRDAKMGVIRCTRRHDESPAKNAAILILEKSDRITVETNVCFDQARDLIAKNKNLEEGRKLTNPTVDELTKRLADAESCSRELNRAKDDLIVVEKQLSRERATVDGVIRQLKYELKYYLQGVSREQRIAANKLYGFTYRYPSPRR